MEAPLITVIVPGFNAAAAIDQPLHSIREQTYRRRVLQPSQAPQIVRLFVRTGDESIACAGKATLRSGPAMPGG